MSKRKRSRDLFEEFFGKPVFEEFDELFKESSLELDKAGTGYSITVIQEGDNITVHAKASKEADIANLRKDLEKRYPKAKIVIEGEKPLIEEIKSDEKLEGFKIISKKDKRPLIEEVK
ncbi:MAG: hypothetical protein QXG01_04845 [Candidatus Bathyarchaeia archaeon]